MIAALLIVSCALVPSAPYRMENYEAPVPNALKGVTIVDDDQIHALWKAGRTVFIDVLPQPPKPDLPPGTLWREKSHQTIANAIWLPDVGYGALAARIDRYFRDNLEQALGGDKKRAVLFFCRADCWMSWNAAKRAREEYGYRRVYWYPEGTDGWSRAGYPMQKAQRIPLS